MVLLKACMDFCAKHKVVPSIKIITADELEEVFMALQSKNDQVTINSSQKHLLMQILCIYH